MSAKDPAGSVGSLRRLDAQDEVRALGVEDVSFGEAMRRHDLDTREDVPLEGERCTPSPLWAKDVDPNKYEIGCKEIEVRVFMMQTTVWQKISHVRTLGTCGPR